MAERGWHLRPLHNEAGPCVESEVTDEVTDVRVAGWSAAQALGETDVLDPR